MGVIMKRGINYTGSEGIELTQAEYDALSTEEKNNGTTYFVTDSAHGGGGGGGSYVLPPATANTLGGVKVGAGLDVTADGTLSATGGAVYTAGTNIDITNNVISATDTTYTAGTGISIDANNVISASSTVGGITVDDLFICSGNGNSWNQGTDIRPMSKPRAYNARYYWFLREDYNHNYGTVNYNTVERVRTFYNVGNVEPNNSFHTTQDMTTYEWIDIDLMLSYETYSSSTQGFGNDEFVNIQTVRIPRTSLDPDYAFPMAGFNLLALTWRDPSSTTTKVENYVRVYFGLRNSHNLCYYADFASDSRLGVRWAPFVMGMRGYKINK